MVSNMMLLSACSTDRQCGVAALPSIIKPSLDQPCPLCQGTDWSTEQLGEECTVFLLGAAVQVRFAFHTCRQPGCSGRLDVDGIEWGLLRKTEAYAFGHELLWDFFFFFLFWGGLPFTNNVGRSRRQWARAEPHNMEHGNTLFAAQRGPTRLGGGIYNR